MHSNGPVQSTQITGALPRLHPHEPPPSHLHLNFTCCQSAAVVLEKIGVSEMSVPALQDPHEVILSRILQLDASEFEELTRALLEALGFEETRR